MVSNRTLKKRKINQNLSQLASNYVYNDLCSLQEQADLLNENTNKMGQAMSQTSNIKRRKEMRERSAFKKEFERGLFNECVFDIFNDALVIDDQFKIANESTLKNLVSESLDMIINERHNGEIRHLKNKGLTISDIVTLCEDVTEVALRNNRQTNGQLLLSEEEEEDFDRQMDFYKDDISDTIKDKVISIIQKEKEISDKNVEIDEKITMDTTPEATTAGYMHGGEENRDETQRKTDEYVDETNVDDEGAPATEKKTKENKMVNESVTFENFEISVPLSIKKGNKLTETTLFRTILVETTKKCVKEKCLNEDGLQSHMDILFVESVSIYTLLETLSQLDIIEKDDFNRKRIARQIINKIG